MPPARYARYPRIREGYESARRSAAILDGVFCYCFCSEHAGHYSLLDCFESDHAARCDVCLAEAVLADRMSRDGAGLDRIRAAVDDTFGS